MSITTDRTSESQATAPRFLGQVAVVTGGGSGIGAATARRLAAEGAHVVIADLDSNRSAAVADEVGGLGLELDVTEPAAVAVALREAAALLGPIDVLVNNAGGGDLGLFVATEPSAWERTLAVNLGGALACTHAVLPTMLERRRGAIVNVASEAGRGGLYGGALYATAKAGVLGFTKSIAMEAVRRGVRVNAVAPGPVDTPMLADLVSTYGEAGAQTRQMMIDASLMRRCGQPDEIAAVIAFLASDDASYITGETIAVSGGVSRW